MKRTENAPDGNKAGEMLQECCGCLLLPAVTCSCHAWPGTSESLVQAQPTGQESGQRQTGIVQAGASSRTEEETD